MKIPSYNILNPIQDILSAVENIFYPTPPDKLNQWEKSALQGMRAQGYRIAKPEYDSEILSITNNLAKKFNLSSPPKVVIYRQDYPNAAMLSMTNTMFISTSLLQILNKDEIEAVIGHEIGHRKQNFALTVAGITATLFTIGGGVFLTEKLNNLVETVFNKKIPASSFGDKNLFGASLGDRSKSLSNFLTKTPLVIAAAFGLIAGAVSYAVAFPKAMFSRSMEMDADRQSGEITHKPEALISGLQKLQAHAAKLRARQIPATDPSAANVVIPPNPEEPKTDFKKWEDEQLASHPKFVEREKQLREIAAKQHGQVGYG